MEQHPRCAIAGPMQVDADDADTIVNAGGLGAYPMGVHRAGQRSAGRFSRSEIMPWINGACMFVRMEAVVEFGLMDESMFLIGSDCDWCFTAHARGWDVRYCADAIVLHEGGVTKQLAEVGVLRVMQRDMDHWRRK